MTRTSRLLLAATLAAGILVPAGSALAAADHNGTLDATTSSFAWDSKLGTGFTTLTNLHDKIPCGTPGIHDCDETLLHVIGTGTVLISNESADPNAVDTDLYVYDSDSSGAKGESLGVSAQGSPTPDETLSVDAVNPDNWFLVEIDYTDNVAGTIHGTATFTPDGA